ncbi:SOS response-associated peptidase family protein (plasmid) [Novosphingobium sp. BL-8A]|uniref:SOS response-associated peptidase n=1 Tax=Novosphingobium sp. BL-8A TaxID=3127639 RepID=UPI00375788CF
MCNLYRLTTPASAIAALFGTEAAAGANVVEVVAPTDPGLVIANNEVRAMAWGFPRNELSTVTGQPLKPHAIYNVRTENIGSRFWRGSFARRRCLIPVNAWAEAEGKQGRMTRTWFSVPGEEVFALAGIWRRSDEWGHVFSMMMVPGHEAMADLNDRMPVILRPEDWRTWTQGSPTTAHALCQTWSEDLMRQASQESWSDRTRSDRTKKETPQPKDQQLSLPL